MPKKYIYYTGVGSRKNGKYTEKEFTKMGKRSIGCSQNLVRLEYKPCINIDNMDYDYSIKYMKNHKYKRSKKLQQRYNKMDRLCDNRANTRKNRKCKLDEFINYVGAERR